MDHVLHYAELCATHSNLALSSGTSPELITPASRITYIPIEAGDTIRALSRTNLVSLPFADTVVLGLVHRLGKLTGNPGHWNRSPDDVFGWVTRQIGGKTVVFLGCCVSFWGDISGELVKLLARRGVKEVNYVGKLGSLQAGIRPNRWLASGESSLVEGERVEWPNALAKSLGRSKTTPVIVGQHLTVPSVLYETKEWLAGVSSEYSFVDPEVCRFLHS